ncbi:MAG: ATP-binding protein [Candidatus Binataceae bacterium]
MKMPSLSRWLFAPGIARKFILISLLPLLVAVVLTVVSVFTVNVLSGLHAYVAGEGLYSKYQKDAVFYLQRYVEGGDEADYLRYFRDIRVPVGDDLARQDLERVPPDTSAAATYFLQGQNVPADVPALITLFIRFRRVPFVERAIQIWTDADDLVEQLVVIGAAAHERITTGTMTPEETQRSLQRIGALNDQLIGLENDFSRTLGEGFDLTSNFLFYAMIAIDVLIVVIGFLLSRTVGRSIAGDIGELSKSVAKIEAGDFSTRSSIDSADELGDLARALNSMAWNIGRGRRELERARDAAMQTSLSKSSFLANLSHEIRTPLHVMLGYADIIGRELGDHPDPVLAGHVDTMRRAGHRLVDTIQGILDFSRIETNAFDLHPTPVDPGALLERLVRDQEAPSSQKGLKLECRIEAPAHTMIMFDEYCLSRALINLLSNAIKFTEHGLVTARLFRAGGALKIEVRDTGVGINPSYLPHLFEPFSQEHTGKYSRKFEGSGLGLALTRSYLQLNDTTLTVESALGKGSTFTIEFPRDCEFSAGASQTLLQPGLPPPPTTATRGSHRVVLVVEDDAASRLLIKALLGGRYDVLLAASAGEARSMLEIHDGAVQAILMDLSLGGPEDGLMLTRELREDTRYEKTPIVALTAHAMPEDRQHAYSAGCNAYMTKPVNQSELFATLDRLLTEPAVTNSP